MASDLQKAIVYLSKLNITDDDVVKPGILRLCQEVALELAGIPVPRGIDIVPTFYIHQVSSSHRATWGNRHPVRSSKHKELCHG